MRLGLRDIQYKLLQGIYWMLYGIATIYLTVFMMSHGISAMLVGTIVAVSNVLAAPGQVLVGTLVDKYDRINWKNLILLMSLVELGILLLMILFRQNDPLNAVLFPAFMFLIFLQNPLVNSALFYYTVRGEKIDFGTARGIGSLAYALISFIMGKTVVAYGEFSIVVIGAIAVVLAGAIVLTMPIYRDDIRSKQDAPEAVAEKDNSSLIAFSKRYPNYMLTVLGLILVMAFHNMIHTYLIMIVENVGGNSGTLGTAFSIEAIVEIPVMFGFYFLIRKISSRNLMAIAGVGFLIKAVGYILAGTVMTVYMVQCLQMISYAVFASASVYYANDVMGTKDKVKGQGYMTAGVTIGGAIGNAVGGVVYDMGGVHGILMIGVAFAAAGAIMMAVGTRKKDMVR